MHPPNRELKHLTQNLADVVELIRSLFELNVFVFASRMELVDDNTEEKKNAENDWPVFSLV